MNKMLKKISKCVSTMLIIHLLLTSKISCMEETTKNTATVLEIDRLTTLPPEILQKIIFPQLINWHIDNPKIMLKNLLRLEQVFKKMGLLLKKTEFEVPDVFFEIAEFPKTELNKTISYEKLKKNVFQLFFRDLYFQQRLWGANNIQKQQPLNAFFIMPVSVEKLRPYSHVSNFLNVLNISTKDALNHPINIQGKIRALEICLKLNKEYLRFPEKFFYSNFVLLKTLCIKDKHSGLKSVINDELSHETKQLLARTAAYCFIVSTILTVIDSMPNQEISITSLKKLMLNFSIFYLLHLLIEHYDTPTNKIIINELITFGLIYIFVVTNLF